VFKLNIEFIYGNLIVVGLKSFVLSG